MKLGDKLWMAFNKKPRGKMSSYFLVAGSWLLGGFIWTVAILGLILGIGLQERSWAFVSFLMFAVLYSVVITYVDFKYKYAAAIHKHYLQRRQSRLDEITHAS